MNAPCPRCGCRYSCVRRVVKETARHRRQRARFPLYDVVACRAKRRGLSVSAYRARAKAGVVDDVEAAAEWDRIEGRKTIVAAPR